MLTEPQKSSVDSIDSETQAVVTLLKSNIKDERKRGEVELKKLGPEAIPGLLMVISQEKAKYQQRMRYAGRMGVTVLIILIPLMLTVNIRDPLCIFSPLIGLWLNVYLERGTEYAIAKRLIEYSDVRSVSALAEALEFTFPDVRDAAAKTLTVLLPQLKASDAGLLNVQQRQCLYRALRGMNRKLIIAILKALEQVGDADALPAVERLANGQGEGSSKHIRTAARACLPGLKLLAEEATTRQTLLRAASSVDDPNRSITLLRPAADVSDVNPALLLRASTDNKADF